MVPLTVRRRAPEGETTSGASIQRSIFKLDPTKFEAPITYGIPIPLSLHFVNAASRPEIRVISDPNRTHFQCSGITYGCSPSGTRACSGMSLMSVMSGSLLAITGHRHLFRDRGLEHEAGR